jgi:hypothetical protein
MSFNPQDLPKGPYLLPEFDPGRGGVDFLGIRQVNLDLMAECLPGINNVTYYIRPYSILSWIYWKFYEGMKEKGKETPAARDLIRFKEKVESLFLWGHQLNKVTGVPGLRSKPREFQKDKANLSFKAWRRSAHNTSLQAAVQYGPSIKDRGGLGFIRHVDGDFYQATSAGAGLAGALDSVLQKRRAYSMLVDFRENYASGAEASDLFKVWGVNERPSKREREIFAESFYDEQKINDADIVGRRSATLNLILSVLRQSKRPLDEDEIRQSMAFQRLPNGRVLKLEHGSQESAKMWLLLQVRQAQRIAMESLLAWVEHRILNHHERTAPAILHATQNSLNDGDAIVFSRPTCAAALKKLLGKLKTVGDYIAAASAENRLNLLWLSRELQRIVIEQRESICPTALKILLLVRQLTEWLSEETALKHEITRGGTARISMAYWRKVFDKNAGQPIENLLSVLIENLVLSQHFAVATNRFDGGRQRLRIILEEDGLEALVDHPWRPRITQDRLATALSLLIDCGFVVYEENSGKYELDGA